MTGFETWTSCVRSDHFAKCATTTTSVHNNDKQERVQVWINSKTICDIIFHLILNAKAGSVKWLLGKERPSSDKQLIL